MSQAKDQDQSMEEILQSIKRIIAEEGTPPAPTGSDVLELTDMLGEDESDMPMGEAPSVATMSIDEIMAAPLSSGPTPEPSPAPEAPMDPFDAAVVPEPAPEPTPAPAPAPLAADTVESLLSESTLNASAAALSALKNLPDAPMTPFIASGVGFRSGTTIEDLVIESLKPMLKEWLDANLTGIVTALVEKEVRKLSARH